MTDRLTGTGSRFLGRQLDDLLDRLDAIEGETPPRSTGTGTRFFKRQIKAAFDRIDALDGEGVDLPEGGSTPALMESLDVALARVTALEEDPPEEGGGGGFFDDFDGDALADDWHLLDTTGLGLPSSGFSVEDGKLVQIEDPSLPGGLITLPDLAAADFTATIEVEVVGDFDSGQPSVILAPSEDPLAACLVAVNPAGGGDVSITFADMFGGQFAGGGATIEDVAVPSDQPYFLRVVKAAGSVTAEVWDSEPADDGDPLGSHTFTLDSEDEKDATLIDSTAPGIGSFIAGDAAPLSYRLES